LGAVVFAFEPPLATHHTQPGPSPNAKQGFLCVVVDGGSCLVFPSFLIDFHFLTNQFTVKAQKKLSWAAQDICPGSTATHWDRGAGLNIAIQKILRPFRGSFPE
jgi:hypothetical protein